MTDENTTPDPSKVASTADGVPDEALTKHAVYDTAELRYLDGTFDSAQAAKDAHKATIEGKSSRYKVRKV